MSQGIFNNNEELKQTTLYEYDLMGRLKKVTNAEGVETQYIYDGEGRLTLTKYPDGTKESNTYDETGNVLTHTGTDGIVTTYQYDVAGIMQSETTAGVTIQYEYYANGKVYKETYSDGQTLTYTYDKNWNVVQVTQNGKYTTKYTVDLAGNIKEMVDPEGNKTSYEMDRYGRVTKATDAKGNSTQYKYDSNGNCIETTNALGLVTTIEYDALNQMRSVTTHSKEKGNLTVYYNYDAAGNVTAITDENGAEHKITYDVFGNVTRITDKNGKVIANNSYDSLNRLSRTTDAMGGTITYSYNAADRIESIVEAVSSLETVITGYSYEKGRLKTVIDKAGKESSYGYDDKGNISSVTDPNGGTTTYAYDSMHRVTSVTDALNQTMAAYTYNADGLLKEEKNGRNQKRTYSYDSLGRIEKVSDEEGTITYTYDANGNVETVKDKNGTISRTYDELNRVKTYTDYNGKTISYSYDELGNLISLTYPGGEIVRYTYDKVGNLLTVTDAEGKVTRYGYDKNGRVTSIERPDGSVETYTYNLAGKVTEAKDVKGNTVIHCYRYTYDLQGNITKIEGSENGVAEVLTTANMTYTKDNRLDTYNGQKIEYDKDGNMTYGPLNGVMTHFEYDCRNRLVKAGDTYYEYDAEDARIAVEKSGIREEYIVNKNTTYSQVLSVTVYEHDLIGRKKEKEYITYTYGIGLISQKGREKQSDGSNKNSYYLYHFNQIGSTSQITDEAGNIVYTYAYSAYGERMGTYDGKGNRVSDNTPIRFLYNGQLGVETDENGLYYMRARYYNTDIKRFMNRDIINGSIANSQSLNKYCYVQGNPVNLTDPFGLCPEGGGVLDRLKAWFSDLKYWYSNLPEHDQLSLKGMIPFLGIYYDLKNAYLYWQEGNKTQAVLSALCAIPGLGDYAAIFKVSGIVLKTAKLAKLAKTAEVAATACRMAGVGGAVVASGASLAVSTGQAVNEYLDDGSVSGETMLAIGASALGLGISLKLARWAGAKSGIKGGIKSGTRRGSLELDLQFFAGNGSPTRRQSFRQAKEAAGIPKSAQYKHHEFVYDGSTENRIVYEFEVNGKSKYIIEHPFDKNGRGRHFHGADDKYGSPYNKGTYNQYDGHFPEDFNGFE